MTAALPHRVNTVNVPVPKGVEQGNCFVANLQAFTCSKWLTLVADVDSRVKFPFVKGTVNESSWNIEHSAPGPSDTPLIDRPPAGRPDRASGLARSSKLRRPGEVAPTGLTASHVAEEDAGSFQEDVVKTSLSA